MDNSLKIFNITAFLKSQLLLLPVLYLFYLSNGLTLSDYFLFQGIAVLVNVITQIPVGIISNYFQRKTLITLSYVLFLGKIILWMNFHGYAVILAGEILGAISKSIFDTTESTYIFDILKQNHKENEMIKSYGKLNFFLSCGTAVASILGTILYEKCGVQTLLGTEFIIMTTAILLSLKLKRAQSTSEYKFSFTKLSAAAKYIYKSKKFVYPILLSSLFAAFSHFFFWSFQPLMKAALVPVYLFGIVIFVNNVLRAGASFYTYKINKFISLRNIGITTYIFDIASIVFLLNIFKSGMLNNTLCILLILLLCLNICCQLAFTITMSSNLQKQAPNQIRGYIASTNMFITRISIAIILIIPKYLSAKLTLFKIYNIYLYVLIALGGLLLLKFLNIENVKNYIREKILIAIFIVISVVGIISSDNIRVVYNICFTKYFYKQSNKPVQISHFAGGGDKWLASDLKIAFENNGYPAVCTDFESVDHCFCTKYDIFLLGSFNNSKSHIKKNHKNILWLAYSLNFDDKNTNKNSFNEYIDLIKKNVKLYDVFAVSSIKIYNTLKDKLNIPVYYIPQFTNTEKFYPDYDASLKSDILFVGNNHFDRKAAKYAIKHNLPISIYGDGWPLEFTKGIYIDNRILRKYYSSAGIVFNDTMTSMKEFGFISNRIFDATASGAFVISDYMPEIEEMYGDSIPMWKTEEEFVKITKYYLNHPEERKIKAKKAREITLKNYTSEVVFPKFEKIIKEN